jgi:hypothetical protein
MSFLNENGKPTNNLKLTTFLLFMLPLILGFIFTKGMSKGIFDTNLIPWILIWIYGISIGLVVSYFRKQREKWKKENSDSD